MALDHSEIYKKVRIQNIPHLLRKRGILEALRHIKTRSPEVYFDVGCSNGYLTDIVSREIRASYTRGWDHNHENLERARSSHAGIEFRHIDLNHPQVIDKTADLVTCFETIEHVGNIQQAVENIDQMVHDGGQILFTVPIESGRIGAAKYAVKRYLFGYNLKELSTDPRVWKNYEKALFRGETIDRFREDRPGWGTHFGFDYRTFESMLRVRYRDLLAWTRGTSRFLLIRKP